MQSVAESSPPSHAAVASDVNVHSSPDIATFSSTAALDMSEPPFIKPSTSVAEVAVAAACAEVHGGSAVCRKEQVQEQEQEQEQEDKEGSGQSATSPPQIATGSSPKLPPDLNKGKFTTTLQRHPKPLQIYTLNPYKFAPQTPTNILRATIY
jgi:hypothetical protein